MFEGEVLALSLLFVNLIFHEGGSDTGLTALLTFILAMICFPHAQREAQEELDRVIGKERLPDHEDEDLLPYVKAVIYECFR